MRTEAELIQLLLNSEDVFNDEECSGLCILTAELVICGSISEEEEYLLDEIIYNSKPKTFDTKFYFPPYQWQPRKEYLETLLKKYKK